MDLSQVTGSIPVRSGQPLRVRNGFGRRIAVLEGNIWVTQDGDPRDIVLQAGDDFRFDRRVAAVITSLDGDARILREEGIDIGRSGGPRLPRYRSILHW